jgi:hypothetical protein
VSANAARSISSSCLLFIQRFSRKPFTGAHFARRSELYRHSLSEKVIFTHLASNPTKPRPALLDDVDDGIHMNQRVLFCSSRVFSLVLATRLLHFLVLRARLASVNKVRGITRLFNHLTTCLALRPFEYKEQHIFNVYSLQPSAYCLVATAWSDGNIFVILHNCTAADPRIRGQSTHTKIKEFDQLHDGPIWKQAVRRSPIRVCG